jgi:hypothetical protein
MSWTNELLAMFEAHGVVRTVEVYEREIPTIYLTRLMRSGRIRRVSNATYVRTDRPLTQECMLVEIAERMPRGIASLGTAAGFFGLERPEEDLAHVSFPAGFSPPSRRAFAVEAYTEIPKIHGFGVVERKVGRASVPVYSPSRTVTDFFKFRRRLGLERAIEVLRAFYESEHWDPEALAQCARANRMHRIMRPYLLALETFSQGGGRSPVTAAANHSTNEAT